MPRTPRERTIPSSLEGAGERIVELGITDHAMNVQVTEWDHLRVLALSELRGTTMSEVVRMALTRELDTSGHAAFIANEATLALQYQVDRADRLAQGQTGRQ